MNSGVNLTRRAGYDRAMKMDADTLANVDAKHLLAIMSILCLNDATPAEKLIAIGASNTIVADLVVLGARVTLGTELELRERKLEGDAT